MAVPNRLVWLPAIAGVVVCTVVLAGQDQPFVDSSMRELIAEVRAIREVVERSAGVGSRTQSVAARAQLLIARLQLQESRLDDLRRRLDEARVQLRGASSPDVVRRLRADEASLVDAITTEQSRWSDYNARLEAVEQEIAQIGSR